MKVVKSFVIAFSMYSKIPMPRIEWTKENMKYVMCSFPWVGAVIGVIFALWSFLGSRLPISPVLHTVISMVIPIVITGGIHLDGLLDTADALSSYQTQERRLEILKDSRAGAFAVITCVLYFFLYYGFLGELTWQMVPVVSMGFFLTRAMSGYAIVTFPCAKDSGLASMFSDGADKKKTRLVLAIQIGICAIAMMLWNIVAGAMAVVISVLCLGYYKNMSMKKFGGITGDLAGWFLQVCELCILIGLVIVQIILS